jgi:cytochrome oxidase Cu insertion factor (SCO1/SenC/PrrC family)
MKRFLILFITILIISGCKRNNILTIEGSLKESRQKYIYIRKVNINVPVIIDSSEITGKGTFRFKIKTSEPDFYQVGYSETNYANLLAEPGERIKLNFTGKDLYNNYTVTGSKGSELVQILDLMLIETKRRIDSLDIVYEKASKEPDFEKTRPLIEQKYMDIIKDQRMFNIEFILKNMSSLSAIKALYQKIDEETYVLYEPRDLQYLKIVSDSLRRYYPESKHTKALVSNFEKELSQFNTRNLQIAASKLPETKLDPDLKDIDGRRIALSSFKGKYVLLAFWSARSRDCIADNLQLKEFYKLYHKQGFEIYQINIDKDESVWRTAVKYDELPWISTREDDPANPKNARLYNVQTIPMNYLYDPEGNIIGTNLHGRNLQIKLNQIFSN